MSVVIVVCRSVDTLCGLGWSGWDWVGLGGSGWVWVGLGGSGCVSVKAATRINLAHRVLSPSVFKYVVHEFFFKFNRINKNCAYCLNYQKN